MSDEEKKRHALPSYRKCKEFVHIFMLTLI